MLASTVMLIYKIVNNKYRVKSNTLCCGHSWIGVSALLGIGREASCSSRYSLLFSRGKSPRAEVLQDPKKSPPKVPYLVWFFLFIWESETFCLPFSAIMMTLSVIMTFSFFRISFLSCCLVFRMSNLTSDFELIGGVAVVETSLFVIIWVEIAIHSARSSYIPYVHPACLDKGPLLALTIGRSQTRKSHAPIYLRALYLGSLDLVIFITREANLYLLGCVVWCVLPGWQDIQHLPPSVLVSLLDPGRSEKITTVSVGIHGHVLLFDTWNLL